MVLALSIVIIGAVLQGSVGFGLGPFAVPLLVLLDARFVPGPLLFTSIFLNGLIFFRERKQIDKEGFKWTLGGRLLGTLIGMGLLLMIPKEHLSLMFAVMILLAVILSAGGIKLKMTWKDLLSAGTLSGIMATTSAIGGAPLALIYQHNTGPRLRATLSAVFVFGTIIAVAALILIGRFGWLELKLGCLILPGALVGFYFSRFAALVLDRGSLRPAILTVSAGAALVLVIQQIF